MQGFRGKQGFSKTYLFTVVKGAVSAYYYYFDFIECFTTTFLRAHSWLNWVDIIIINCMNYL